MLLLQDGALAFLSAVGLTTIVWTVAGALLHLGGRPAIPGLLLVLPLKGEALAMEADVRELRRVQGALPGAKIVLADCGLSAGTCRTARAACLSGPRSRKGSPARWTSALSCWTAPACCVPLAPPSASWGKAMCGLPWCGQFL